MTRVKSSVGLLLALAALSMASSMVGPGFAVAKAQTPTSVVARQTFAPPAVCFAPGTSAETVKRYAEFRNNSLTANGLQTSLPNSLISQNFQYSGSFRWFQTATNTDNSRPLGAPITLTWGVVPDGTAVGAFGGIQGESNNSSNLRAFLNGIYGSEPSWTAVLQSVFDQWGAINGVTYVHVTYDDGAPLLAGGSFPYAQGILGVRPDLRISGHFIDGPSNVLAYNFFPDIGDMIIDTGDNFYNNTANNSQGLVNVLAHEHGHGLGLDHSCPVNQTKLMEPFVSFAFTGVQLDDKLGSWRANGDDREDNDTAATAANLGSLSNGTTTLNDVSIDDDGDTDFYKFTVPANKKAAITVTPIGTTYLSGPQIESTGQCTAGTNFNALTVQDLAVELRNTNGTSILASANATGAGSAENIAATTLPGAGTYFVRAFAASAVNNVQGYQLQVTISDAAPSISINDSSVTEGNSGTTLMPFTVSLSAPAPGPISVTWATADGTATTANGDYVANGGVLSFTLGQLSQQVSVTVNGDQIFEANETFVINLTSPSNATIADSQGVGTINNDDNQKPLATTGPATAVTDSTVSLNGTVNPNTLATDGFFNYGLTTGYGSSTGPVPLGAGVTNVLLTVGVTDLACNTLYHFRIVGTNAAGTTNGGDNTFTTGTCPPPPVVTTGAASTPTQTGATLSGTVNPNGGATNRRFEYGLTTGYGFTSPNQAIGNGNAPVAVNFVATGLACNTLYHYRAVGQNSGGTTNGNDATFTTAACPAANQNNITAANARNASMNSTVEDFLNSTRTEVWYKVELFANRSYQFSAWTVGEDGATGISAMSVSLFSDAAGVTAAVPPATSVSTDLEGSPNGVPLLSQTTTFQPATSGQYRIRVLGAPAASDTSLNLMLRETTLFSPWFFVTTTGYDGAQEIHNNTAQALQVTLRAFGTTGTQLGVTHTFTLPANATVFKSTITDLAVPGGATFGGVVLTHNGAFGAISANTTTLSAVTGLSFDSPFTPRNPTTSGLPLR